MFNCDGTFVFGNPPALPSLRADTDSGFVYLKILFLDVSSNKFKINEGRFEYKIFVMRHFYPTLITRAHSEDDAAFDPYKG